MKLLQSTAGTLLLSTLVAAVPTLNIPSISPKTIYQFSAPGTWIENIFSTRTGSLLIGLVGPAELHLIEPTTQSASLINAFPPSVGNSIFGIAEPTTNQFAVVVGNTSVTGAGAQAGSFSIWNVDLRLGKARVSKIADLPTAQFPNGMTALNYRTLLIADAAAGNVIALNTDTKQSRIAIDHPTMKYGPDAFVALGINGLKFEGKFLYYTNTYANSINRVQVNLSTGAAVGAFTTLVAGQLIGPDDFTVTEDGTAYVAENFGNSIAKIDGRSWARGSGTVERVVGDIFSTVVAGPTSVTLGRTWKDSGLAYAATNGARNSPVNGTFVEPGKVVVFSQ